MGEPRRSHAPMAATPHLPNAPHAEPRPVDRRRRRRRAAGAVLLEPADACGVLRACAKGPPRSPWPPGLHAVSGGVHEEGLSAADVDGDGKLELVAGLSWYRPLGKGCWERHEFARGYVSPKNVAGDFDGDGRAEIVISEGDASLGREYGRVVYFKAPSDPTAMWEAHVLHDKLLEPAHSLPDGRLRRRRTIGFLCRRDGTAPWQQPSSARPADIPEHRRRPLFVEQVIDEGIATHEAKVIVLDGKTGIVGKPYRGIKASNRDGEADSVHILAATMSLQRQ